jgi:transcriptional regulator with XRE-family HTH domain
VTELAKPLPEGQHKMGSGIMASTALKKASAKRPTKAGAKKAEPEKRKLNRVGTLVNSSLDDPKTIGERMTAQRLKLGLTQEQVASKVVFIPKSGSRRGDEIVLSRNAYCMYETHGVAPDLQKIEEIAKALEVSPGWLAFGIAEEKKVVEFVYDPAKKSFVQDDGWVLSHKWLKANYNVAPDQIGLYMMSDYTENFVAGDVAIIEKGSEPNAIGSSFIFAHKGDIRVAHISRPARSESIRVFSSDLKSHEELPLKSVVLLGKVIGKIGNLERN